MAEVILEYCPTARGTSTKGGLHLQCTCCVLPSLTAAQGLAGSSPERLSVITRHIAESPGPMDATRALNAVPVRGESVQALKDSALQAIDGLRDPLTRLCDDIWSHPELAHQEIYAHQTLCEFLRTVGDSPAKQEYLGLKTAFKTEFGSGSPTVAICAEYDALPEIGHACGHNLIATSAVAAFLGVKKALESGVQSGVNGKVVLLGTPAEEACGGKQELLDRGAFADVDCSMMVHPAPYSALYVPFLSLDRCLVKFNGVTAHASANPWDGKNALDAMIHAFNGISAGRQQMKPTWRVHGVITSGGQKPNIIPDFTEAEFAIRAPNDHDLQILKEKVTCCFNAAALATGCEANIEWCSKTSVLGHPYSNIKYNSVMNELFRQNIGTFGKTYQPRVVEENTASGSTDMGNVSHAVPSIHPMFAIDTKYGNHHRGFTASANTVSAMDETLVNAKAMAMTILDLFADSSLIENAKAEFAYHKKS
eukprot:gnl/MRDRNA2_/MRDRNA2_15468_c0_seq1.p1 gnl/MRDRNA2_/MRDRNA2_15468_c0~~gnl/MRDRNA2_/MRDRNA2_15468_c0_seq1.p1  ORF type:complete len:480 (+),score=91.65 gnl/MRDRNA2_/MRDRNA2_15468_c0_seq1:126-1565(+)